MSKKSKRKKRKSNPKAINPFPDTVMWQDDYGQVHSLMPGPKPSRQKLEEMTNVYQENIRKSPLWNMMVKQFGPEKSEELLKECRVELK